MTLLVCGSAHGSPGVSVSVQLLAAAWPGDDGVPTIVEAADVGGVLAARFDLGLAPGFVSLVESLRKGEAPPLLDNAQQLPSGVACVPLSPSATAASAQLRSSSGFLGPYLRDITEPVFVDVGSVRPDSPSAGLFASADCVLWFVRPVREELAMLRLRILECPEPSRQMIVMVGAKPYSPDQVGEAMGIDGVVALPIDERAARAIERGGDDRYLRRAALTRACTRLSEELAADLHALIGEDRSEAMDLRESRHLSGRAEADVVDVR